MLVITVQVDSNAAMSIIFLGIMIWLIAMVISLYVIIQEAVMITTATRTYGE